MAAFLTHLDVRKRPDGKWQLLAPLRFRSERFRGELVAPSGFVTDFASTPRMIWWWLPKDGPWSSAAVMHDAGFHHALLTSDGERVHLIKTFADTLFDEALEASGVGDVTRKVMVATVRAFGTAQISEAHKRAGWVLE